MPTLCIRPLDIGVCCICCYLKEISPVSCVIEIALSSCSCVCPTLAVTEMLVNVLNIHSEDDNDEPTEPGGKGGVGVTVG